MVGFLARRVTGPWVLVANVAAFAYGWFLLQWLPNWSLMKAVQGGQELQERFGYGGAQAARALAGFDAATREAAFQFYALDLVNAALFALSVGAIMAFGLRRLGLAEGPWRHLLWLPLAAGLSDMLENGVLAAALAAGGSEILGGAAGLLTSLKIAASVISLGLMFLLGLSGLVVWVWGRLRHPAHHEHGHG